MRYRTETAPSIAYPSRCLPPPQAFSSSQVKASSVVYRYGLIYRRGKNCGPLRGLAAHYTRVVEPVGLGARAGDVAAFAYVGGKGVSNNISAVSTPWPFPEGRRCACAHIAAALGAARRTHRSVAIMVVGFDERDDVEARSDDAQGALFYWQAKVPGTRWTRIGTATFAVVVASVGASSEAYAMATDLLDTVDPASRRSASGAVGAWLGLSLFPEDSNDALLLLARAEAAFEALRCLPQSHGTGPWRRYQAKRVAAWRQ